MNRADIAAMNAYNLSDEEDTDQAINTDPVGSAQKMLADLGQERTQFDFSPTKQSIKRTRVTPVSGKGAKGMAMEYESLTRGDLGAGQDAKPKAKNTDSARSQLEELARQYQLRLTAAKDKARGLSADTFGAPTLEGPTLTKNRLAKKRFQKGGEVVFPPLGYRSGGSPEEGEVAEESSASRALKSIVSPVMEGLRGYAGLDPSTSGSDAYRMGQAFGNMPGVGVPGALAGIFIGKGAKGWNSVSNALAKKMADKGAAPEEVWKATGNFKAPDGMWRQEISDAGATLRESVLQGPANRVLLHPELFSNYPELGKIMTSKDPYSTRSTLTGGSEPNAFIRLGTAGGKDGNAKGMLHELQHAIQFQEGFGQGGSSAMAFSDPRAFEVLKEVRARMAQPASLEKFAKVAWQSDEVTPEIAKKYQEYLNYHKKSLKTMDKAAQEGAADLYYKRLLGEAESRAVEDRKMWTPEQRLQVIPSQSYRMNGGRDIIPLDKLIVKRQEGSSEEGEVSDAEREAASRPAFVTPKSGRGRKEGPISRSLASGEAYSAMAQGAANLPYNLVGAPVDLTTMLMRPAGYRDEKPAMGSDWIKEKMTAAGVRPEASPDPTLRGFNTAGDLLSNLVNPAGATRAAVKGAQKAGQVAADVGRDFQGYNRQLSVPGASYAVRPEGSTMMVRRGKGGNEADYIGGLLNEGVENARNQVNALAPDARTPERAKLMEEFWNNKAANYFSKQFGTESDPVYRLIREQKITSPRLAREFPDYVLDQLSVGKTRTREGARPQEDFVGPGAAETRFFPKYPAAFDATRRTYDQLTNVSGAVPERNPARVMGPEYTHSQTREGQTLLREMKDREIDKMMAQGTPADQANVQLDFLTRSLKDPDTVIGPYYSKQLLKDYEKATGTRIGDPNFRGIPDPAALPEQNLKTAIDKGEIIYSSTGPQTSLSALFNARSINEYLASVPERELKNIRFEDAVQGGAKITAKQQERETLVADIRAGKRVADKFFSEGVSAPLVQVKEGPLEGFAWKRITNPESTVPEGAYVGHSVGGYAKGGQYGPEKHKLFNEGKYRVYTLRDNRNRPVNTIEVRMDSEFEPVVTQIKGNGRATGNTAPVNYDQAVLQFFQDYLKPTKIEEGNDYLTPILQSYKDALRARPAQP